MPTTPSTINDYKAQLSPTAQQYLEELRQCIKAALPAKAQEVISYGIPAFKLNKVVIYFCAYKAHASIYPAPRTVPQFAKQLAAYKGGKGTMQIPYGQKIPTQLIAEIAKYLALKQ